MTFGTLIYALLCLIGAVICVFYLEFGTVAIAGILVCIPIFMFLFLIFMKSRVDASVDSKNPMTEKDDMDKPAQLKWSVSGNKNIKVTISNDRVATLQVPDQYWNGSEDITFIATDSKGATGSETVNFNVESVNNPPEVKQIPDQTIDEGKTFAKIKLDDYVTDPDHPKNQILWEFDISPIGKDQADGDLNLSQVPTSFWMSTPSSPLRHSILSSPIPSV